MSWLPKSVVCLSYYDRFRFRSDVFAALIVALQVFPLVIAIAVASGLPPLNGICCSVIAGLLASALGDSKIRVSGPNIILVGVASGIVAREGILGLSLSTLIAGALLMFLGAIGLGAAVQMLPRAVVVGLSTGIALLIMTAQLPDLLGISSQTHANEFFGGLTLVRHAMPIKPHPIILASITLILILASRRKVRYVPTGLIMIILGAFLVKFAHFPVPTVETLYGSNAVSFHLHPAGVFKPDLPGIIVAQAFAIAVLVAIESLQTATLAASTSGERFYPDGELVVHGGVNVACAFVGGLPASGASSYTAENAHFGAQTPFAGMLQAVFLGALLMLVMPLVRFIPLPVISALILSSVFGMSHWREIPQLIMHTHTEVVVSILIALLTIVANLPIAIASGMFLGIFLYVQKLRAPAGRL